MPAIDALIESLKQTKDKPVDVEVLRDGQKLDFLLKPVLADDSEDRTEKPRYRIGFQGTTQMKVVKPGVCAGARTLARRQQETVV